MGEEKPKVAIDLECQSLNLSHSHKFYFILYKDKKLINLNVQKILFKLLFQFLSMILLLLNRVFNIWIFQYLIYNHFCRLLSYHSPRLTTPRM